MGGTSLEYTRIGPDSTSIPSKSPFGNGSAFKVCIALPNVARIP